MSIRSAAISLFLALAACAAAPTSAIVSVTLAPGVAAPGTLALDVYAEEGALVRRLAIVAPSLPGQLIVKLPDRDQRVRLVMTGPSGTPIGVATVQTRAHEQVAIELALFGSAPDQDGDGVPDLVDNCPRVANPEQGDVNADGSGDACAATGDGGATGVLPVGFASTPVQHNTSTIGVTAPVATAAGDLLVLGAYTSGQAATAQTPAGWTLYGSATSADGFRIWCYFKLAGVQEGRVEIPLSASTSASVVLGVYRGASPAAPLDPVAGSPVVLGGSTAGAEISFSVPSFQVARPDTRLIALLAYDSGEGESWKERAGWSKQADTGVLGFYDAPQGAAGPTGPLSFSASYSSGQGKGGAALLAGIAP